MNIKKIKVEIRAEYGTLPPEPNDGQQGAGICDAYTAQVIIKSPEPQEKLERLIAVCRDACMAIATVATAVPTKARVFSTERRIGWWSRCGLQRLPEWSVGTDVRYPRAN